MQPIEWWNSERVARDLQKDGARDDCISRDWSNCFIKYSSSKLSDSVELIPRKVFVFDELPIHYLLLSRSWVSRILSGTRVALWVGHTKLEGSQDRASVANQPHSIIHIKARWRRRNRRKKIELVDSYFLLGKGKDKKGGGGSFQKENATDAEWRNEQYIY